MYIVKGMHCHFIDARDILYMYYWIYKKNEAVGKIIKHFTNIFECRVNLIPNNFNNVRKLILWSYIKMKNASVKCIRLFCQMLKLTFLRNFKLYIEILCHKIEFFKNLFHIRWRMNCMRMYVRIMLFEQ